ncbi:MAG: hypothetical protein IH855_11250 [Bacteroidetes bacterium]|nr:hypothetical protein [Bacteroidota bacterium]
MRSILFAGVVCLLAGCAEAPEHPPEPAGPPLFSAADSLAFLITESAGGLAAWEAMPVLRFDWVVERDSEEVFRVRHLWDRESGAYRVEYPVGEDSMLVAVFSVDDFDMEAPTGKAYLNGVPVDSTEMAARLRDAYERFINDSYWLLAPLKLFDPGVHRNMAPDSSDAESSVLRLTFENVGLTPGDRYWLRADSAGKLMSWSFLLESGGESHYAFMDFEYIRTPAGSLYVATRKQAAGRAILTQVFAADSLDRDIFLDPRPRL